MPATKAVRPSESNTPVTTDLVKVNVNNTLTLRSGASKSSSKVGTLHRDEVITRISKASTKVDGTYWDYVMKSDGTKGYAARETYDYEPEYKLYLVPVNQNNNTTPTQPENNQNTSIVNGDITGDGKVDSMDMYYVIQYILGNMQLNDNQKKAIDLNNDGKIDSMDMYLIIQIILKE